MKLTFWAVFIMMCMQSVVIVLLVSNRVHIERNYDKACSSVTTDHDRMVNSMLSIRTGSFR